VEGSFSATDLFACDDFDDIITDDDGSDDDGSLKHPTTDLSPSAQEAKNGFSLQARPES